MQYEIRAMSFAEILDTGFRIVRNHFLPLFGMAAILHVPLAVISDSSGGQVPTGTPSGAMFVGFVFALIGFGVVAPVVTVAVTYAIGEAYQGRTATIADSFRETLRIFLPMIGTSLLGTLFILLGALALLIPGIWIALGQTVLSQVMIFERRFGMDGIRRSFALMKDNRLRGFGVILLAVILISVLGFAFGLVASLVPYAGAVANGLAQAIGTAFTAAVTVVLYFDIRCRKEAFEIEHIARLVQQDTAARNAG